MLLIDFEINGLDKVVGDFEERQKEIIESLKNIIKNSNIAKGGISISITSVEEIGFFDVKKSYWKNKGNKKCGLKD